MDDGGRCSRKPTARCTSVSPGGVTGGVPGGVPGGGVPGGGTPDGLGIIGSPVIVRPVRMPPVIMPRQISTWPTFPGPAYKSDTIARIVPSSANVVWTTVGYTDASRANIPTREVGTDLTKFTPSLVKSRSEEHTSELQSRLHLLF